MLPPVTSPIIYSDVNEEVPIILQDWQATNVVITDAAKDIEELSYSAVTICLKKWYSSIMMIFKELKRL